MPASSVQYNGRRVASPSLLHSSVQTWFKAVHNQSPARAELSPGSCSVRDRRSALEWHRVSGGEYVASSVQQQQLLWAETTENVNNILSSDGFAAKVTIFAKCSNVMLCYVSQIFTQAGARCLGCLDWAGLKLARAVRPAVEGVQHQWEWGTSRAHSEQLAQRRLWDTLR